MSIVNTVNAITMSESTETKTTFQPLTVKGITGAYSTMQYAHFLNPVNPEEVIINFDGIAIVVNRRLWNMEGINTPVLFIRDMTEITIPDSKLTA